MPFKRRYICPKCGEIHDSIADIRSPRWESKLERGKKNKYKHSLKGVCRSCKRTVEFTLEKEYLTPSVDDLSGHLKFLTIHPKYVEIKHNELTGEDTYYLTIPDSVKSYIKEFDPEIFDTSYLDVIKAVFTNKALKLRRNAIYHFKTNGLTGEIYRGRGESSALAVFPILFFVQVLQRSQEFVGRDRTANYRGLTIPPDTSSLVNYEKYKDHIEKELEKWREDPNYFAWFPVPIQQINFSGEFKNLFLGQEIEALMNMVLAGLEIPREFVYGGLTYSGSSVSLRMLENNFIEFSESLNEMISSFVVPVVANYYNLPIGQGEDQIRFQKFKMADDMQAKQLMLSVAQAGAVSKHTLLQTIDPSLSWESEKEQIKKENEDMAEITAKAQTLTSRIQFEEQMRQNIEMTKAQMKLQGGGEVEKTEIFPDKEYTIDPILISQADQIYNQIKDKGDQTIYMLMQLQEQVPAIFDKILERHPELQESIAAFMAQQQGQGLQMQQAPQQEQPQGGQQQAQQGQQVEPPLPEQKPPRRQNSPI